MFLIPFSKLACLFQSCWPCCSFWHSSSLCGMWVLMQFAVMALYWDIPPLDSFPEQNMPLNEVRGEEDEPLMNLEDENRAAAEDSYGSVNPEQTETPVLIWTPIFSSGFPLSRHLWPLWKLQCQSRWSLVFIVKRPKVLSFFVGR